MQARAPSLLIVAVLLAAPASVCAQSVREVAARVHSSGGYGERLRVGPSSEGDGFVFGGGGSAPRPERAAPAARRSQSGSDFALGAGSGAMAYVLMAIAIVAVVVLVVMLLARMRPRSAELAPRHAPRSSIPPSALPGRGLVDLDADPDALAAEGRFAEAIAAALIAGLRAAGWRPQGLQRSRTAREILDSVPSDDLRRSSLAELVRLEERVAFGGAEPSHARWQEARARWIEVTRNGAPS